MPPLPCPDFLLPIFHTPTTPDQPLPTPLPSHAGFQEVVALNAQNVIWGDLGGLQAWDRALGAYLNGEDWCVPL